MKNVLIYIGLFIVTSSCSPFVDSPFSDILLRPERDINGKSLNRINDIESDNVVRIAVFSDSHQNYKALDKATFVINQETGIDFVAGLGDYTNSAYNFEYDQFIDNAVDIKPPTLLAIGNHDSIGAGPELFKKAFGKTNFYFESTSYRFIFFDSNNLENPKDFDPQWLLDTVNGTAKKAIIFSHVQLRDPERFFGNDATILGQVIAAPNVQAILNGHNHVYDLLIDNNTVMLQCARVEADVGDSHWLMLELKPATDELCVKRMDTGAVDCRTLKH